MSTPHNAANVGDIAKLVLMPGDPLRAKYMAEKYLDNPVQFNNVRGMMGFTGTYHGHKVSIMGSGMGAPSIGIYSYELFAFYGVEAIIRIGSTGSMKPEVKIYDVVLVQAAYSESTYAKTVSGYDKNVTYPTAELNEQLQASAHKLNIPLVVGNVNSSDVFYSLIPEQNMAFAKEHDCCCAEMESFALFHNAAVNHKKAACLLTVSDSMVTHQETTAEEREHSFTRMVEVALQLAEEYD